ncbi:Glycosyltransferase involved in cell wall bisynthesis [Desulfacinum infernum DSM 9756]|uniref:Glycosyltransferase involved in cell wall bisynthesis n=1 Tax=Desulfacinum infernum DSM 9756 TaxID=1121391 RepID=A0A1M4SPS8_9BACT|nr:glycosyltransferase family 4 protein [Desulfacinum infernum]SHE34274.1 Glycosyltransferase involved in cell wall bisynthesis [Desulfacinum infernum DSM 9756]
MRILHVETGRHLYGGAYQVLLLLKGLADLGMENILVAPHDSAILSQAASYARTHPVRMGGDLDPRLPLEILRAIRSGRPHWVHVHSRRGADWWGGAVAGALGIPAMITRRVDNPEPPAIVRLKYRCYRRVVAISSAITKILEEQGVPSRKLALIPSAVPTGEFAGQCARDGFLRRFHLEPDHLAVGMIAQFIPRKGHHMLLQAAPMILESFPTARFLLFGKGPLLPSVRQECENRGLGSCFRFPGFRHDLPRILPCLDLVVHPASMEGLGVSLIQAAAAGKAVVACRAGGIPEVVRDRFNGLLVEPGDVEGLAGAVNALLGDPEKRRQMGEAGRRWALERFSPEAMVARYAALYKEIAS